jgi:peptidyl-prolyl cis-trans isomerase SurA
MEQNRSNVALGIGAFGAINGEGYLFQREVVDRGIQEVWKRRAEEHKVAVIFTAMNPDDPADTARALRRALDMLTAIRNGANFARIAADSTDDPSTKRNQGELGWITGGMLPREMEDAIVETPPGEIYPGVVRLPAGFVLVKVLDRGERIRLRSAHMPFEIAKSLDGTDNRAEARAKAEKALSRLNAGESFETVAREMSEDRTSAEHGGDLLAWYTRSLGFESRPGKLPPIWEETLYSLKDGEHSGIIEDPTIGFRIVKRLDSQTMQFEDEETALRSIYKRNFFDRDRYDYIRSSMRRHNFSIDPASLEGLLYSVDTLRSAADPEWDARITQGLGDRTLFRLGERTWSVSDWIDSVKANDRFRGLPLSREAVNNSIEAIVEFPAMRLEAADLEERYPDFARLMQDFRDGALIFELEQGEVYSQVKYSEEEGREFFEKNRDRYITAPQLTLTEVYSYTEEAAEKIRKRSDAGEDLGKIAAEATERMGYREKKGAWPLNDARNSDLVRSALDRSPNPEVGEIIGPFRSGAGWSVVRVDDVAEQRRMTYEEARGEVMGDFNDWKERSLREKVLASLRKKFDVDIDEDALKEALEIRG